MASGGGGGDRSEASLAAEALFRKAEVSQEAYDEIRKNDLLKACDDLVIGWWTPGSGYDGEWPGRDPTKKDAYWALLNHFVRDPAQARKAKEREDITIVYKIVERAKADFDDVDKEELVAAYDLLAAHDYLIPVTSEGASAIDAGSTTKRALLKFLEAALNQERDDSNPYPWNWVDAPHHQ